MAIAIGATHAGVYTVCGVLRTPRGVRFSHGPSEPGADHVGEFVPPVQEGPFHRAGHTRFEWLVPPINFNEVENNKALASLGRVLPRAVTDALGRLPEAKVFNLLELYVALGRCSSYNYATSVNSSSSRSNSSGK